MKKILIILSMYTAISSCVDNASAELINKDGNETQRMFYRNGLLNEAVIKNAVKFYQPLITIFNDSPEMTLRVRVTSDTTTVKSPISNFTYGANLMLDFKKHNTAIKLGYGPYKNTFYNAELIFSLNPKYKIGAYFYYGFGKNNVAIENKKIDLENKQKLMSSIINLYYQMSLSRLFHPIFGIGLGYAQHKTKLNLIAPTIPALKKNYSERQSAFAYKIHLGFISNINKFTALELNYSLGGLSTKNSSIKFEGTPNHIAELKKIPLSHNLMLGLRIFL